MFCAERNHALCSGCPHERPFDRIFIGFHSARSNQRSEKTAVSSKLSAVSQNRLAIRHCDINSRTPGFRRGDRPVALVAEKTAISQRRLTIRLGDSNQRYARHEEGNHKGCPYEFTCRAQRLAVPRVAPLARPVVRGVCSRQKSRRSPAASNARTRRTLLSRKTPGTTGHPLRGRRQVLHAIPFSTEAPWVRMRT